MLVRRGDKLAAAEWTRPMRSIPATGLPTDAERLRIIYAVQRMLSAADEEATLVREACEVLASSGLYLMVGIGVAEPDGSVSTIASSGNGPELFQAENLLARWDATPLGNGVIGQAIRTGLPTTMPTSAAAWDPWRASAGPAVRSVAAFPFGLDDTVGVFIVQSSASKFVSEEIELISGLAHDVGRTLENLRMRVLLAAERDRARRSEERLAALWKLTITRDFDLDSQAQAIISEGVATLGFDWGTIGRVEGETLFLDFVVNELERPRAGEAIPLGSALSGDAIAAGRTVIWDDLRADARLRDTVPVIERGLRAFTATPFYVSGRLYVLNFGANNRTRRPLIDDDRSYIDLLVAFFSRALQRRDDEAQIRYLRNHDPLTGLPNRERFLERLDAHIERAQRSHTRFALFNLDVDRFRATIEDYGAQFADEVIAELGRRLSKLMLEGQELFRNSGDSFTILFPELAAPEQADSLARTAVEAVAIPLHAGEHEITISASVGMALFPDDGTSSHALTMAAATALTRAKRDSKREVRFFSRDLDDRLSRRRRLIDELQGAASRGELVLHYQPWIDLSDYGVGGCEALVRWEHPRLGLVEPDDFITLAEETDLIHEVGRWVFQQAARTAAQAAQNGSPLVIAINLSARQFTNPDLIGELRDAISSAGTDPHTLEVEVTESFTMRDPMRAAAVLTTLREMGLRIALDDFGIGHSSLGYLKHLPVDIIKIDRSFVNGIPREAADAAIARAVIALAQSIRCEARAEGVESHDQALWLAAAGCRTAQGFWISRPLPQAELTNWLRERRPRL